jgi:general secretion pathway protein H
MRDLAVQERTDFSLHFDLGANRFWREQPNMSPEERLLAREQAKGLPGNARIVDVSSLYAPRQALGDAIIHFTKKGYVEPTVIHLEAEKDSTWTIVLSPFLTKIKVYDRYVDVSDI